MFTATIAALALSAAGAMSPFSHLVHAHPALKDNRVSLTIRNNSGIFRDVKLGDKVYTVGAQHSLNVKAPAGTIVYAASSTGGQVTGDKVLEITPELNKTAVVLK